ncbi:MAG TPA: 3-methylornithyl-N6-L-lysine dehydrogenase PylD [Anaerovoracaceae bacterium]|nr:3-methylornithyl-N6-L-lysine dehydrogenase PylD [Anaerovoracaceae bacterium]
MTRLKTEWIEHMLTGMERYNANLKAKTDLELVDVLMKTSRLGIADIKAAIKDNKIAAVPITQGEGIIGQFSQSVQSIIASMGFDAEITDKTDIDGIYSGLTAGHNIFFFADDNRYLALNVLKGKSGDNNYCTALGFIHVMKAMMAKGGKNIGQEKLLVIGYGIVGREAVAILNDMKIDFDIYDKDYDKIAGLDNYKLKGKEEIKNYQYILDFTNEGSWLSKEDLDKDVLIATPGVPYSLDAEAEPLFEANSVHDNLEIGTAVMLGQVL